eukprot:Awhi_evm1s3330
MSFLVFHWLKLPSQIITLMRCALHAFPQAPICTLAIGMEVPGLKTNMAVLR